MGRWTSGAKSFGNADERRCSADERRKADAGFGRDKFARRTNLPRILSIFLSAFICATSAFICVSKAFGPRHSMIPALRTENLTKRFGDLEALTDVSIALPVGARHALIGPNGAGKTTFLNLLTGVLAPSEG